MEETQLQYFRLFRDVSKAVNSSLNVAEVLKLIAENTVAALNVKACTIFLLDKDRKILEARASHGLSESYLKKGPVEADKSISGSFFSFFSQACSRYRALCFLPTLHALAKGSPSLQ